MKMYKILVVDDEINNIKSIVSSLIDSNEPYILYQALNAELAYKIAVTEQPDLIITDWEMPELTGIDLIKMLKDNELTSDIPVVMCTGVMINSENLRTALMSGAVDFIRKPIDRIELFARVKSMLEISNSRKMLKEKYIEIESKNKYIQALINNIPHPFVHYNFQGVIKGYNRQFGSLLGVADSNFTGKIIYEYLNEGETGIHFNRDILLKTNRLDSSYTFSFEKRDYICSKTLFCSSIGEPDEILCVMMDVTELNQAHNDILENKKKELTSSALRLIQFSELNKSLVADLSKINDFTNEKGCELIRQIITKFNINTGDSFWLEFESRFIGVYEKFYEKLNQLFPDLTSGEKKLCALLRLNLTSKDIATITFQNPQSIDMARYRLRKKMNLSQNENLIDFLMKIS